MDPNVFIEIPKVAAQKGAHPEVGLFQRNAG
jgi:hypothetical protein